MSDELMDCAGYSDKCFWLSYAIVSTIGQIGVVLLAAIVVAIFNPSGFKKKVRNNKYMFGWVLFGSGFGWAAYGMALIGCPAPGLFTAMIAISGAAVLDGVQKLMKDERDAKK